MWQSNLNYFNSKKSCKITISDGDKALTFRDVVQGWKDNADFRTFYISLIKELPFDALFWETPAITHSTFDNDYEFVVVESKQLINARSNSSHFAEYLSGAARSETVVTFNNLGGDAVLIVPCAVESERVYAHFLTFIRGGKEDQCHELFYKIGIEISGRISDEPLWLNTSGLGVYWLHVRLDTRPKYYTHLPYKADN